MIDNEVLADLSELFKMFADQSRIRILYSLFDKEICVCDIAEALDMTQSAVSHQLRLLKQSKLVKSRRDGKQIYYSLDDDHVKTIIDVGINHIMED
ncbi:MAG: metalloregulator ArsR/SmtB family transcription factor [Lachnospiraceae bacterium]|nr:metalloregulator ArsR/SmtB family transcription factor [Lachnospiraceae bacterium]